jgi:hypothetical protein
MEVRVSDAHNLCPARQQSAARRMSKAYHKLADAPVIRLSVASPMVPGGTGRSLFRRLGLVRG